MTLKNYGRNHKKRKEYIKQSGLLLVGVDVSKAKHDACIGSLEGAQQGMGVGPRYLINIYGLSLQK